MKGAAISTAVLAVVGLAAGLPSVGLVTGWVQGGIGSFGESAAVDRIDRIQSRIDNKCQTNIQTNPGSQSSPATYTGKLPGISSINTSEAGGTGTKITYEVTGPEEVRTTSCDVSGSLDLEPSDDDDQNPEYEIAVACSNCDAEPPQLSLSVSTVE